MISKIKDKEIIEDLMKAALEAFPIVTMYGGNQPSYDDNEHNRAAFIDGFKFCQWIDGVSMSHSGVPLHIKYRMYRNQMNAKPNTSTT